MNILVGKIGKSVRFNAGKISTGDDTCMILLSTMSRMLPEHNFYILGPNDLNKLSENEKNYIFPNKNVFSIFQQPYKIGEPNLISFESTYDFIIKNNIHFDFGLFITGYVGNHTLCNCLKNQKTGEYYLILNAFKHYAGPYIHILNKLGLPYYTIAEDPRYITVNANELFNRERIVFTQCTERYLTPHQPHIRSYEDHTFVNDTKVKCEYGEVERIFLMGIDKEWRKKIDVERKLKNNKNPKCIVISNGHGCAGLNTGAVVHNGRLKEYKKYIIDGLKDTPYSDTKIYGKWDDPAPQDYPQIQNVMLSDLGEEIADAKYSFVYSIIPGFVTIKPFEMIVRGLIPFLHPDYDKDNLLHFPKFLYVKSPEDFVEKMKYLDENPEKYKLLLEKCFEMISSEYTDGSHIVNKLMHRISEDLNFKYEDHKGVPSLMDHFGEKIVNFDGLNDIIKNKVKSKLF